MGLLQTLCLVKMDTMDGNAAAGKQAPAKPGAAEPAGSSSAQNAEGAKNGADRPNSDKRDKVETEMKGKHEHRRSVAIGQFHSVWWHLEVCRCYNDD